jgi:hypothetical protein
MLMVKATERSMDAPMITMVCPTATIPNATDRTMIFSIIAGFESI